MSESLKENTPKTAKAQKLVGVKGMNDILPPDSAHIRYSVFLIGDVGNPILAEKGGEPSLNSTVGP